MSMIRTFTETYDMNTTKDCPTLLGIHTPIGPVPYKFLSPCFRMYRKYKYLGCSVTIVNSAKLPVDPAEVGKTAGTNYVDPRDMLNPILFKGCHGESLGKILDSMYAGLASDMFKDTSLDQTYITNTLNNFYYTALGDDSWRKSNIQKTLHITGLHPMVYSVSVNHQIAPTNMLSVANYKDNNPVAVTNPQGTGNSVGAQNGQFSGAFATGWSSPMVAPTTVLDPVNDEYKDMAGLVSMFTSKMHRLGWMDTMQFVGQNVNPSSSISVTPEQIAMLPKIFMGLLMLPPGNLCLQYLRVLITHKFAFAGYRSITTGGAIAGELDLQSPVGYYDHITGNTSKKDRPVPEPDYDHEPIEDDEVME